MQTWSDTDTPGTFVTGAAKLAAATGAFYQIVWIPTARPAEDSIGIQGFKAEVMTRTNQNIYAVGVKERIRLETAGGKGWQWRRICFTMKGDDITGGNNDPTSSNYFRITSDGMMRLIHADSNSTVSDLIFEGDQGRDWENPLQAKLDRRRVTVKYDRVRTIQSGNESGVNRFYNLWHPMRKNIVYGDEQQGEDMFHSPMSTTSKAGMGDYYIVDYFYNNLGSVSGEDDLNFQSNATFYWHEK